jgi:peptidoglycan/LPS O-acetylase OafA/YrhL
LNLNRQNRYAFADGLRGLAALWVVLYHLNEGQHVAQLTKFLGTFFTSLVFEHGNLGVPIFFVLSGFVMAITTESKKMGIKQSAQFMLRRLARLSPPYYIAMLLSLVVIGLKVKHGEPDAYWPSWSVILAHMVYLQGFLQYQQINVVFWTLCYEMQFYFVFSIFIYFISQRLPGSLAHWFMIFLMTIPALLWLVFVPHDAPVHSFVHNHLIFIYYWYAFCAGTLVGWCSTRGQLFQFYLIAFYGCLIVIGAVECNWFAITAGLTSFIMHMAMKYKKMNSWLNYTPLQLLGLVSYSLYLIHNNITGAYGRIFRAFFGHSTSSDFIFMLSSVIVCFIAAYIMYILVEKPSIKMSQKIKY